MKDYYKSLELNFGATSTDIKTAYRRLAKKYHPDLHFGNKLFEEKFKDINEAYSILNDKAKKDICISVFHHTAVILAITSLSNIFSPKYLLFNLYTNSSR